MVTQQPLQTGAGYSSDKTSQNAFHHTHAIHQPAYQRRVNYVVSFVTGGARTSRHGARELCCKINNATAKDCDAKA